MYMYTCNEEGSIYNDIAPRPWDVYIDHIRYNWYLSTIHATRKIMFKHATETVKLICYRHWSSY